MRRSDGFFDELDFFSVFLGDPQLKTEDGRVLRLIIPAVNVGISEHPLHSGEDLRRLERSYLTFDKATASERRVVDYDAAGRTTESKRTIVDIEAGAESLGEEFVLEGIDGERRFYNLSWTIRAESFALWMPETSRMSGSDWLLYGKKANLDLSSTLAFFKSAPEFSTS